ncbi:MAG: hypothetical protein AAF845_06350 [Bacteroidota bacterium]
MASYSPCQIHIGGAIPRALLPDLAAVVNATGAGRGWGGGPYHLTPDEIEECEGGDLPVIDDQARFGAMVHLEKFLLQNQIDFDRATTASSGQDACVRKGRNTGDGYRSIETHATSDCEPALVSAEIEAILEQATTLDDATARIRRALGSDMEDLAPLRVI